MALGAAVGIGVASFATAPQTGLATRVLGAAAAAALASLTVVTFAALE